MLNKVEIEVADDLVQEVIRRYQVLDHAEPVHLALRSLLFRQPWVDAEYDELSESSAIRTRGFASPAATRGEWRPATGLAPVVW
jgi:Arc/MetJ family transcription regulator